MSALANGAKKWEGLLAAVLLKQKPLLLTLFFGDWVYHFRDNLRVDANHPVILLDEHSAYMKLEAAANLPNDLFPVSYETNHEVQPLNSSFVSPSRVLSWRMRQVDGEKQRSISSASHLAELVKGILLCRRQQALLSHISYDLLIQPSSQARIFSRLMSQS